MTFTSHGPLLNPTLDSHPNFGQLFSPNSPLPELFASFQGLLMPVEGSKFLNQKKLLYPQQVVFRKPADYSKVADYKCKLAGYSKAAVYKL